MSKNKKLKNKGVIPSTMTGLRFGSLSDLGNALGFKPSEQPTPRSMKCWKCGTVMRHIPETNVWLCDGMVEQEKDGVKKMVPCGNRALTSTAARPQTSESPGNFKFKHQGTSGNVQ